MNLQVQWGELMCWVLPQHSLFDFLNLLVQYMLTKCCKIQNLNFNFKFIYFIPHKKKTLFWDKSGLPGRSWCFGTLVGVTTFRGKEN